MGKILNTTFRDSVSQLTGFYNDLVNNPFYLFNDQKPTICTYYNINKDYSTLDPGSKLAYDNIGEDTPIRFNRIYDFILFGFNKIQLETNVDDFGVEAEKITGDCVVIPNNFIPTEGDYFEINHIKDQTWLFIVTDVQKDTLDNGANVYKIMYRLEYNSNYRLLPKIIYNFRCIEVREGTNIISIVRCEDYDTAEIMDNVAVMLKKYFCDLFYRDTVQTFIYEDLTEYRIYDPYMIEFLMRNKILNNGDEGYIHVDQKINLPKTFSIDYDKTFLRCFELRDKDNLLKSLRNVNILDIRDVSYGTIFFSRFENYYRAVYVDASLPIFTTYCIDEDLLYAIKDHKLVKLGVSETDSEIKPELWKNVIIKYFYDENLTIDEVNSIKNLNFDYAKNAYYIMPLLIFILEKYITKTLNDKQTIKTDYKEH